MKKNSNRKILIVNASSLTQGGALTILMQLIHALNSLNINCYVFISSAISLPSPASPMLHLIPIDTQTAWKRIRWDWYGLKRWIIKKKWLPCTVFSLQNTSMRLPRNCQQFIYLHQALPLHEKSWSFLKKEERSLAFYKYIYPLFIFLFAKKDTCFIVQTEWMKNALQRQFKRPKEQILVFKPQLIPVDVDAIKKKHLTFKRSLFYPANGALFKNHQLLLKALALIKKQCPKNDIALYFTITPQENPKLMALIQQLGLEKQVFFLGAMSFLEVLEYYQACTAVVFPSSIESFGLPLLEAAQWAKPLIVANEAYAHEVIGQYKGAIFVKDNSPLAWKDAILESIDLKHDLQAYQPEPSPGWNEVIDLLTQ